ncbi:hypothetical protein [Bradyrhizobium sp. ARR65]|uniref:hypothetical protein n=1 Tax=Bradyrhizobium sp. ARR65 TaxID=1040989 RepID=UPI00046787BD|nr:hypothetical protein [Bradyrhizobium sp. ARR65]
MGFDIVGGGGGGGGAFPVGRFWWVTLADYSHHVAPSIAAACRYWYSNDEDGLDADQARQLGAELQRSVDNCVVDAYAREYFAYLRKENNLPDFPQYDESDVFLPRKLTTHEQERVFVNEFVAEVQRFIEFLLACDGFAIL